MKSMKKGLALSRKKRKDSKQLDSPIDSASASTLTKDPETGSIPDTGSNASGTPRSSVAYPPGTDIFKTSSKPNTPQKELFQDPFKAPESPTSQRPTSPLKEPPEFSPQDPEKPAFEPDVPDTEKDYPADPEKAALEREQPPVDPEPVPSIPQDPEKAALEQQFQPEIQDIPPPAPEEAPEAPPPDLSAIERTAEPTTERSEPPPPEFSPGEQFHSSSEPPPPAAPPGENFSQRESPGEPPAAAPPTENPAEGPIQRDLPSEMSTATENLPADTANAGEVEAKKAAAARSAAGLSDFPDTSNGYTNGSSLATPPASPPSTYHQAPLQKLPLDNTAATPGGGAITAALARSGPEPPIPEDAITESQAQAVDAPIPQGMVTNVVEACKIATHEILTNIPNVDRSEIQSTDIETYLEFIAEERFIHMPPKGSRSDRIFRAAEFFGVQMYTLGKTVGHFVLGASEATEVALWSCQRLLRIGHNQAQALEPTFNAFYELGILVAQTIQRNEVLSANQNIKQGVGNLYDALVRLVARITVYYVKIIRNITTDAVIVDFDGKFGEDITRIWKRKEDLSNQMWNHKLRGKSFELSIEDVRRRLRPDSGESIMSLLYGRMATKPEYAPGTCEWFSHNLLGFFRSSDDLFAVVGGEGVGKTVLADWVKERLRRPLGRATHDALFYAFASDVPAEGTAVAMLKSLIFQLLERNVGDARLFKKLVDTFTNKDPRAGQYLENALWDALDIGIQTLHEQKDNNLVLIVDGLDEEADIAHDAKSIQQRLHACVGKFDRARAITFARTAAGTDGEGCRVFNVTPDEVRDDISLFIGTTLETNRFYAELDLGVQEDVVQTLTDKSKGKFIWAYLAVQVLLKQRSRNDLERLVGELKTGDVKDCLRHLSEMTDLSNRVTRNVLPFMLAAERPLTVNEMKDLIEVDTDRRTATPASEVDVRNEIQEHCRYWVNERKGLLRFKHSIIRKYILQDLCGRRLMSLEDAHREIVLRLLHYAKHNLPSENRFPSFEILDEAIVLQLFRSHPLLEYTIKNWTIHFKNSPFIGKNDTINMTWELTENFPDTVFFPLLEWTVWAPKTSTERTQYIIGLHDLALRVRTACLGDKHPSIMQSFIVLGTIYNSLTIIDKAATYFYRASTLGQTILDRYSPVVITCTTLVLDLTEKMTFTKRTEIVTIREEMITFIISFHKKQHGPQSDFVVKWYKVLLELYAALKEKDKITIVLRELREIHDILIRQQGSGSRGAKEVTEAFDIDVVLHGDTEKRDDVKGYTQLFLETAEREIDEFSVDSIMVYLGKAMEFEKIEEFFYAEKLYIKLWRYASEQCRVHEKDHSYIKAKFTIATHYVRFLQRQRRTEEASNILICIWAEYESLAAGWDADFMSSMFLLKEISILMRDLGMLALSVTVLKLIADWFKNHGKPEDVHDVETEITTTVTKITESEKTETTTTTKTSTTTTTKTAEEAAREVFESTLEKVKKTSTVEVTLFRACTSLVSVYFMREEFTKAEEVIKRSLEVCWSSVLTEETTTEVTLTKESTFHSECVTMATQLAICYHKQHLFEKAEFYYLRIFRACFGTLDLASDLFAIVVLNLVRFYEQYHRHSKLIDLYLELLGAYRGKFQSQDHKVIIRTLYALAAAYSIIGSDEQYKYYIDIVTILNKGDHCHPDAFDAAIIVCKYYSRIKAYSELADVCKNLWATFVHYHQEYHFTEDLIKLIYDNYLYVLQEHTKVSFKELYELSRTYRKTVTEVFGVTSSLIIHAMISQAHICEKSEEHREEAIEIYEETLEKLTTTSELTSTSSFAFSSSNQTTTITTTEVETITRTVKERLTEMYVTVISENSSQKTKERGADVCHDVFRKFWKELGIFHKSTLGKLTELVGLYLLVSHLAKKLPDLLESVVIEIVEQVTTPLILHECAKTMAIIYRKAHLVEEGYNLLERLREVIILRNLVGIGLREVSIKLDAARAGKVAFVFLAVFEEGLSKDENVVSFSEIMADILFETYLFEQYTLALRTDASIENRLQYGALLRAFWLTKKRMSLASEFDQRLFEMFGKKYGVSIRSFQENVIRTWFFALLEDLGIDRSRKVDFSVTVCAVTNAKVKSLHESGKHREALDVARCAFTLIDVSGFYKSPDTVGYGYKLAELLAGIALSTQSDHEGLPDEFLEFSKEVLATVLHVLRETNIQILSLKFEDLAGLINLLGRQRNYEQLEFVLTNLWQSREVQKTWSDATLLSVGTLLVHAHFANRHHREALRLCETIVYNLRRSRGWLDEDAVDMSDLLARLYIATGRFREAMRVHEEVLREIDDTEDSAYVGIANEQLKLLRSSLRRYGRYERNEKNTYQSLYEGLERLGKLSVPSPDRWQADGKADPDAHDEYVGPEKWNLATTAALPAPAKGANGDPLPPTSAKGGRGGRDVHRQVSGKWYGAGKSGKFWIPT